MRKSTRKSMSFVDQAILSSIFTLVGVFATIVPVAASNMSCSSANKLALRAYCSEAYSESVSLANGSTSYKRVANRASERAMEEYPNVCPDISAWKTRITAVLDQYGDEGLPELCNENPDTLGSR
jgi:ABC-type phosphate transport system substrate-binding protein